jgi:DNA-binding transcriptional LysR family regulator
MASLDFINSKKQYQKIVELNNQIDLIWFMEKSDYSNLDFKALQVLKLVYELGSLSAAAAKLGQNQSSVSYTIERLRAAFGDPLFVRAGRGVDPTLRCREIIVGVEEMLDQMAELARSPDFDPALSEDVITISCNHFERSVLLPPLIRRIQSEAPGMKLMILQSMVQGHSQLNRGECDIFLSPIQANFENLYQQKLLEDKYVIVTDANNSIIGKQLTLEQYGKCQHVTVTYEGGWRSLYSDEIEAKGVVLDIVVEMPSSGDLHRTIEGTDLILTLPSILGRLLPANFKILPSPFETGVSLYQFWNNRTHHSPAHRWVRKIIAEIGKEVVA